MPVTGWAEHAGGASRCCLRSLNVYQAGCLVDVSSPLGVVYQGVGAFGGHRASSELGSPEIGAGDHD